jgi:hypothetical protein
MRVRSSTWVYPLLAVTEGGAECWCPVLETVQAVRVCAARLVERAELPFGETNVPSSSLKAGLIGVGVLAALCGPILGLWAYARWANQLPPPQPAPPPLPSPNGYTQAVVLLARLPVLRYAGPLSRWPDGPPDQLRRVLLPARPLLDQVRATFRLE